MARRKRNYTVRTGDTAATIAKQLGIDPQTLMRANTGVSNLRAGMVIRQPPTPPAQLPSGGGMYWGKGVYDALQGFGQNVSGYASNAWDQFVNQWQQQPLPTYNVQDIQSQRTWPERIFSPETVAQLAAYQRPAGTPPDPRELFSQYRNSTDLRQQYSQNNLFPATDIRQQYGQGGVWGPNLPSGVKPGLMPAQGTTAVPPGGGVGGDYGFL